MKHFSPSATGKMTARAQALRSSGVRVYDFAAGDPVIANHPLLLEALEKAAKTQLSPYAPVSGLKELKEVASSWMNQRYLSHYMEDNTLVTCGGKFVLYAALQVLLAPNDEVLIPTPYWVSYPEMVLLASGVPVPVKTDPKKGWKVSVSDLEKKRTPKTKVLLFNNACNPTGTLYAHEELKAIFEWADRHHLFILSDEVYSEIVFEKTPFISLASFPEYREKSLIVESCSKNFAMAGWRVGFAFGDKNLIQKMTALQSHSTTGTCWMSQKVAFAALSHAQEVATYVRTLLKKRRDLFFKTYNVLFQKQEEPTQSAIYFFAPIKGDSIAACEDILQKAHVALVPGIAFGMEGFVRFAFSQEEAEVEAGLQALARNAKEHF